MRSSLFGLTTTLALAVSGASCPRLEESAPARLAAPSPASIAQPSAPVAAPAKARAVAQGATISAVAVMPAAAPALDPALPAVAEPAPPDLPPEIAREDREAEASEPAVELDPEPAPRSAPTRPAVALASIAKETSVYAEPGWKSRRLGYLRAGAVVERRRAKAAQNAACPEGWYRVEPRGYVCVGALATLDLEHPVVELSARRPSRDGLPYTYVIARNASPLYARLPSAAEAQRIEPDLQGLLRLSARTAADPAYVAPPPPEPIPAVLLGERAAPGLANDLRTRGAIELGRARPRAGFALLATYEHEGRRYGLTTELATLPLDRTRVVKPSAFAGLRLEGEVSLPVAFVKSHHAVRYAPSPGGLGPSTKLEFREAVPLSGNVKSVLGVRYLEARDGSLLREDQALRIDAPKRLPGWAASGRTWIDVSILKQSLVAYEGVRPVYVTLVSTGADGLGDPKKTHSTIQGVFRIHTKHVSVTMDDDTVGGEFDLRDVPFVQYFTEGFALHGAYWHDDFGTPRSHGCVNLSPKDAAWLFNWTGPEVPAAWHGAMSLHKGTLVYTHP